MVDINLRVKIITNRADLKGHKLVGSPWRGGIMLTCKNCTKWCALYADGSTDRGSISTSVLGNHFFWLVYDKFNYCEPLDRNGMYIRKQFRKKVLHGKTYKELFDIASDLADEWHYKKTGIL